MADRDQLREALPHYVAVILVMFAALVLTRAVAGSVGFAIEVAIVIAVSTTYFFVVRWLGIAPSLWE